MGNGIKAPRVPAQPKYWSEHAMLDAAEAVQKVIEAMIDVPHTLGEYAKVCEIERMIALRNSLYRKYQKARDDRIKHA